MPISIWLNTVLSNNYGRGKEKQGWCSPLPYCPVNRECSRKKKPDGTNNSGKSISHSWK